MWSSITFLKGQLRGSRIAYILIEPYYLHHGYKSNKAVTGSSSRWKRKSVQDRVKYGCSMLFLSVPEGRFAEIKPQICFAFFFGKE